MLNKLIITSSVLSLFIIPCHAITLFVNNIAPDSGTYFGTATFIDSAPSGTLVGTGSTSAITDQSDTYSTGNYETLNPGASPNGGNFVTGPASGQGNIRTMGVRLSDLVTASGASPNFIIGERYEATLWLRPTVYNITNGSGETDQWYFRPDNNVVTYIGGAANGETFTVSSWLPTAWTEVQIPFDFTATTNVNDIIQTVSSSVTLTHLSGSNPLATPIIFLSDTRAFQIDYGVSNIPEPSSSSLLVIALTILATRRKR